jgi:UDP-N-acetyl-D-glucosamine dehydrogenase
MLAQRDGWISDSHHLHLGSGLGGHCFPIDPFYLSWGTKEAGIEPRFIELAGYVNSRMPDFVVAKIQIALNNASRTVRGSRVHVLGRAYKRDVNDIRESPSLDVMSLLQNLGALVSFSDRDVSRLEFGGVVLEAQELLIAVAAADCVVILTHHSGVDYGSVLQNCRLVLDTRNALRGLSSSKIVRL